MAEIVDSESDSTDLDGVVDVPEEGMGSQFETADSLPAASTTSSTLTSHAYSARC